MKRVISAALAFSLLGGPLALAQQPPPPPPPGQWHGGPGGPPGPGGPHGPGGPPPPGGWHGAPPGPPGYQQERGYDHRDAHWDHDHGYEHGRPPPPPGPRYGWGRGERIPPGQRYAVVHDWHHYRGLYPPPPGQQWVQYNNQFYLVAIASGLIGAILGAAAASQY
ncbi:RcnB family protein [Acidisoma sp. C75]